MKLSTFTELLESVQQGGKLKKQLSIKSLLEEAIYRNSDAEFIGYQESRSSQPIACFNILNKKSDKFESTVTEKTLQKLKLQVPEYPSFSDWKKEQQYKR
jgi:hypothetical protein